MDKVKSGDGFIVLVEQVDFGADGFTMLPPTFGAEGNHRQLIRPPCQLLAFVNLKTSFCNMEIIMVISSKEYSS